MVAHQLFILGVFKAEVTLSSLYQLKLVTSILGWVGDVIRPSNGQSFNAGIQEVLKKFTGQWMDKLEPRNDVERAKANTMITFGVNGKRNVFLEESLGSVHYIIRNCLLFLRGSKVEAVMLVKLITEYSEKIVVLVNEDLNLASRDNFEELVTA